MDEILPFIISGLISQFPCVYNDGDSIWETVPLYVFAPACIVPLESEHKRPHKPWRFGMIFPFNDVGVFSADPFRGPTVNGLSVAHLARWIQAMTR